ncbi:MAG: PD-(D/E)XK nuclease family protein [Planctomycetes bacterium]|nr:PD-(D/E)XK nuclease family protein [Planctomycetota bacterium]
MITVWSYSKLSTWTRCPAQFRFRYLEQAPVESVGAALLLGSAVHHGVQLIHSRRKLGLAVGLAEIQGSVTSFLEASVRHAEAPVEYPKTHTTLSATLDLSRRLIETYLAQGPSGEVVVTELELTHPIAWLPGLKLTGVVDRIESDEQGGLRVVELKTASKRLSQAELDASDQVTIYALLLDLAGYPGVKLRYEVLTKAKRPHLLTMDTVRTPNHETRLLERIDQVSRAVASGVFPRVVAPQTCRGCAYRKRCGVSG